MPTDLLDATSSPTNRATSAIRSSCSAGFMDEIVPTALYSISGDDTAFVIAPHDWDDLWDEASLDARQSYARILTGSPLRHTDYRIAPFRGQAISFGQFGELSQDRGTSYDAAAFRPAPSPTPVPLGDLAGALGHQIDPAIMVRTVVEALREAFHALTELDADQVHRLQEAFNDLRAQLADIEVVASAATDELLRVLKAPPANPWMDKLLRLKQMASLTDAEVARLFAVSRSNVQGWLHRGQGMHSARQHRLLEILKVLEDAYRRLGEDEQSLRQALLTPVSPEGQTPFDYLAQGRYLVARGYLHSLAQPETQRRRTARRAPIRPVVRLSEATRLAALEALSPSPRVDADPG